MSYHHHGQVTIHTDGACSGNGRDDAISGIGVAIAGNPILRWSIPVDDSIDPCGRRTSSRAELLAVIEGIKLTATYYRREQRKQKKLIASGYEGHLTLKLPQTWIFKSDSEDVVDGMGKWIDYWRVRGRMCFAKLIPSSRTTTGARRMANPL